MATEEVCREVLSDGSGSQHLLVLDSTHLGPSLPVGLPAASPLWNACVFLGTAFHFLPFLYHIFFSLLDSSPHTASKIANKRPSLSFFPFVGVCLLSCVQLIVTP